MKIVHLIAGAGPMYCGSCMHGNTLAAALRKAGADVILAPVYTPLRTDEENVSIDRLAMGGINVYLDESLPLWRWMPALRAATARPAVAGLLGRSARQQHPPGTAWPADGGHVPRRRRAVEKRYPTAYRLAAGRGPARHRAFVERHARRTGPSARASGWACRSSPRCPAKTASWKSFPPRTTTRPGPSCGPGPRIWPGWWPCADTTPISWPSIWPCRARRST